MTGKDKIPILIIEKGQDLIKSLIPKIIELSTSIGIENLGQPDVKVPDICLLEEEIKPLIDLRNNMIGKLNSTTKTIENLSKSINPLNVIVNTTDKTLKTLSTAKSAAQITIPLLPTPTPGAPSPANVALIVLGKITDLENKLLPKVNIAKNSINNISTTLDQINSIIFNLINVLNPIDLYLSKCKPTDSDLTPLNDYIEKTVSKFSQVQKPQILGEIYQGFILEIVTVPFSPTINKVKAVAKNNNGIVLLQSPESFTTNPQVLIEEIKLIIDKDNLKAN
jgi:hypothetical protein